jgi:hypothetical protein
MQQQRPLSLFGKQPQMGFDGFRPSNPESFSFSFGGSQPKPTGRYNLRPELYFSMFHSSSNFFIGFPLFFLFCLKIHLTKPLTFFRNQQPHLHHQL